MRNLCFQYSIFLRKYDDIKIIDKLRLKQEIEKNISIPNIVVELINIVWRFDFGYRVV